MTSNGRELLEVKLILISEETIAAIEDVKCGRNLSKAYTDVMEMLTDILKDDSKNY